MERRNCREQLILLVHAVERKGPLLDQSLALVGLYDVMNFLVGLFKIPWWFCNVQVALYSASVLIVKLGRIFSWALFTSRRLVSDFSVSLKQRKIGVDRIQ